MNSGGIFLQTTIVGGTGVEKAKSSRRHDQVLKQGEHTNEHPPSANVTENPDTSDLDTSPLADNHTSRKSTMPLDSRYAHSLPGHPQYKWQTLNGFCIGWVLSFWPRFERRGELNPPRQSFLTNIVMTIFQSTHWSFLLQEPKRFVPYRPESVENKPTIQLVEFLLRKIRPSWKLNFPIGSWAKLIIHYT